MIIIHKPYVYKTDEDKCRLESVIEDEINGKKIIWYEVPEEYSKYLCPELADAFLLVVLPVAMESSQDIRVECNVSPKLLFNIEHTHIPFYSAYFKKPLIKVSAKESTAVVFNGEAVITGCSFGVDSFSTILRHIDKACPKEYALTHLSLFNSVQIGNVEQSEMNKSFLECCEKSKKCADEIKLPFLGINSNIASLIASTSLLAIDCCHYYSTSCIMSIQKMVKKYLFSSSYTAKCISVGPRDVANAEGVVVPLLGNENVEVILSDTFTTRVEKTRRICGNPLVKKYLDVCWADSANLTKNGRTYYLTDKTHRNCGWCDKCMRTLITLELIGCIEEYSDAFDLEKYRQHRKDYIIKVVANAKYNIYYQEILDLMHEKGMHIPFIAYVVRFFNVKDSKLILWLWQSYNDIKRKYLFRKRK